VQPLDTSTVPIRKGGQLSLSGTLPRFSPDSARTKNPVATMIASQKIDLAAFDFFMLLVLFCTPAFPDFPLKN